MRSSLAAAWIAVLGACTAFEGLEPPAGAGGSKPEGGGGEGGAIGGPTSLLPELEAAHVCALVFQCPPLGASIVLSTGVPVVEVGPLEPIGWNYSACVDWLTAPLEPAHVGFDEVRNVLVCMAATKTCEAAGACAPIQLLGAADPLCAGQTEPRCEGDEVVACPQGIVSHCGNTAAFPPASVCATGPMGEVACSIGGCSAPELTCGDTYAVGCGAAELRVGLSCSIYGLACTPSVGCTGAAGPTGCSTLGAQECSTDQRFLRTCAVPIQTPFASEIDCEASGRACLEEGGATARCARPTETCSPYDPDQNLCDPDGTTIRLCVQGEPDTFDCAKIGKACLDGSGDGTRTAHCG